MEGELSWKAFTQDFGKPANKKQTFSSSAGGQYVLFG